MTVVYINAVQYQTCPNHESDNHFFAKIPGGGSRPPVPPSGSALGRETERYIRKTTTTTKKSKTFTESVEEWACCLATVISLLDASTTA